MQNSKSRAWLTPDNEPIAAYRCNRLFVPDTPEFRQSVSGALYELTLRWNWEQFGTMTPDDAAALMLEMYNQYMLDDQRCNLVPAPFWDDASADDANDTATEDAQDWYGVLFGESTWQEQLEDWAIAGFIAYAGAPGAALQFLTIAPRFRLLFKSQNWGGIARIFIDGAQVGTVDTYSASPGVVAFDVDTSGFTPTSGGGHTLWIENSGEANPAATTDENDQYRIQVIRKQLSEVEVLAITDIRQQAGSGQLQIQRGGSATWEDVPTANNVRVDGSVPMTADLEFSSGGMSGAVGMHAGASPAEFWLSAVSNHHLSLYTNNVKRLMIGDSGRFVFANDAGQGDFLGKFTIRNTTAALATLVLRNAGNQSGNSQEWRASDNSVFARISSGGAALFRDEALLQGMSSTQARDMARFAVNWLTSTDATRKAQFTISAYDAGGAREVLAGGANGNAATIGFLGASPVARQNVSGDLQGNEGAKAAIAALAALGLVTDSTTLGVPVDPCGCERICRVDSDGVYRCSDDGGDTWVDRPADDPRTKIIYPAPTPGDDARCNAAASMTRYVRNYVDEALSGATSVTNGFTAFLTAATGFLAFVGLTPAAVITFLLDVFVTVTGYGVSAVDEAFSEDTYDALRCMFYCAIDDEGVLTDAALTNVHSQIDAQIGGVAALILHGLLNTNGAGGLTNAGRLGLDTDNCSSCLCPGCNELLGGHGRGGLQVQLNDGSPSCTATHWGDYDAENDRFSATWCGISNSYRQNWLKLHTGGARLVSVSMTFDQLWTRQTSLEASIYADGEKMLECTGGGCFQNTITWTPETPASVGELWFVTSVSSFEDDGYSYITAIEICVEE